MRNDIAIKNKDLINKLLDDFKIELENPTFKSIAEYVIKFSRLTHMSQSQSLVELITFDGKGGVIDRNKELVMECIEMIDR